MKTPIINPISQKMMQIIADDLPQSLLITGESGVGTRFIADYISGICKIKPSIILPEKDEKTNLEEGIIGVDIIRRLFESTKSKSIQKQIYIIDYAERMNSQAQNAFLKLLEEPNQVTHFILACHNDSSLLPTVLSRLIKLEILPATTNQSRQLLDLLDVKDSTKLQQILFMADGLPAEITKLSTDDDYFNKKSQTIIDAKSFLKDDKYTKMQIIQKYKDSRSDSLQLLKNAANILKFTAISNPQTEIFNKIDNILNSYKSIEQNGNIKLILAKLVL